MDGAICPKCRAPYIIQIWVWTCSPTGGSGEEGITKCMGPAVGHYLNLNLDMDPFPHMGVQGGHYKVYGDIRPKHRGPYPHLNIDMDLLPTWESGE